MKKYKGLPAQDAFFIFLLIFYGAAPAINAQDWTTELPKDDYLQYFWGFSGSCKNEREAAAEALNDAKLRISGFVYEAMESILEDNSRFKRNKGQIIESSEEINAVYKYYTGSKLAGIREEKRQVSKTKNGVEILILVSIEKRAIRRAREDIINEPETLSENYTREVDIIKQDINNWNLTQEAAIRAYRRIIGQLNPLHRSLVEYRGIGGPVKLYNHLEKEIEILTKSIKDEKIMARELYFTEARFYSIGTAVGSSFAAPWLIGTFQFTASPLKYTIIEAGCDFGFLHGYSERSDIDYYSFYPFVHIGPMIPMGDVFFWYAGVGGGYMLASYKTPKEDNFLAVPALDAWSGIYIGGHHNYFNIGYALRINPWSDVQINHKIFAGYSYRF